MSASEDLKLLLAQCALGNRDAFAQLYHETSGKLFGVVFRILKDKAETEDAVQDIYIKIWNKAGQFAPSSYSPYAWLVVIARNHAIDMIRARKAPASQIEEAYDLSDETKNPEEHALNTSDGRQIDKCMSELEQAKAQALRGAYVEGYSYAELATHFNVPLNTMRTWLRRSLRSLRECLER